MSDISHVLCERFLDGVDYEITGGDSDRIRINENDLACAIMRANRVAETQRRALHALPAISMNEERSMRWVIPHAAVALIPDHAVRKMLIELLTDRLPLPTPDVG